MFQEDDDKSAGNNPREIEFLACSEISHLSDRSRTPFSNNKTHLFE